MAATTVTSASTFLQTRQLHAGTWAQKFTYKYNGITLSASDVIFLGQIPQGAIVLDGWAWGGDGGSATTFKFGYQGSEAAFAATTTISTSGVVRLGVSSIPKALSLSSDAQGQLQIIITATKVAGTSTITGCVNLTLLMYMPPA